MFAGRIYNKRYFNIIALINIFTSFTEHFSAPLIIINIPFNKPQFLKKISNITKTLTFAYVQIGTGNVDRPPNAGFIILYSIQIEILLNLFPFPIQPTDVILKAIVIIKNVDDILHLNITFSNAQMRKLEITPAIPSTLKIRINKIAETEIFQNSFTIYFTQPLKPIQIKQDIPGTNNYILAIVTAKPYALIALKNTVVPLISIVEPKIQNEGLKAITHYKFTRMDSIINAIIRGLFVNILGTEKLIRYPFQKPSQTPNTEYNY